MTEWLMLSIEGFWGYIQILVNDVRLSYKDFRTRRLQYKIQMLACVLEAQEEWKREEAGG